MYAGDRICLPWATVASEAETEETEALHALLSYIRAKKKKRWGHGNASVFFPSADLRGLSWKLVYCVERNVI